MKFVLVCKIYGQLDVIGTHGNVAACYVQLTHLSTVAVAEGKRSAQCQNILGTHTDESSPLVD